MNMQQEYSDDLGLCPSFSCYSSNSPASTAATRVSFQLQQQKQQQQQQQQAVTFYDEEDFEFPFMLEDKDMSSNNISSSNDHTDFPLFDRNLLSQNKKVDREEMECSELSVCSCSDSSDGESASVFCVWRYKNEEGSSPKCKKSSSTGSGSKRWRIRDLLRRSNSEGKEPIAMLSRKKVEVSKQGKRSGEVSVLRQAKPTSVHELLYVQQRAKREGGKRRSYLPYRQGLVGFFTNVNGLGKKL